MSYISYASGVRYLQLIGGAILSFYDWYSDLPPASPEVWGNRTDVGESADWYHSRFIVCVGSNLNMTRTPDAHFAVEARHGGAKLVVLSPDFSQVSKHADEWIPVHAGQDCAFWMAVNHVILREFHVERPVQYFLEYLKQYTDAPMLVTLETTPDGYRCGQLLRAGQLERYREQENADWKFVVQDEASGELRMLGGAVGHRWGMRRTYVGLA
jgi:nitrate reductase alpha subunit